MKARATFPFGVDTGTTVTVSSRPDGPSRQAGTTYAIPVSADTSVEALCAGIASVVNGELYLAPVSPLDLTAELPGFSILSVDAIVYGELPLDEVKGLITKKADGSPRRFISAGDPPAVGDADPDDWSAGDYGVYVEQGAAIWSGVGSATSSLSLTLSLVVRTDTTEYRLDAHELLRALSNAGAFDPAVAAPDVFSGNLPPSNIVAIGPVAPGTAAAPIIETLECGLTGTVIYGPAPEEKLPTELAFLSPAGGAVTVTLTNGVTGDWSAVVAEASTVSLATASAVQSVTIANVPWNTLPASVQSEEAVTCAITVTISGSTAIHIQCGALQHPPVTDSGRASRAAVPLEGSPRVAVGLAEVIGFASFVAGASVTVGGTAATEVSISPDNQRLYFTVPAGTAGAADLEITNGDGATASLNGGLMYTDEIPAGLEGLKAALEVSAEEAALQAEQTGGSDMLLAFCSALRLRILDFQDILTSMLPRMTAAADVTAWQQLMADQARFVVDTVNHAVARLDSPPIASFDGQPIAGTDDEPDYDIGASVIMTTALDNVIVRSSVPLGT